ncbi:hypothetical protein JHK82_020520 [Glycine max]|nr:hypothetical protein JHK86_020532 [Glycine max]KAG5135789.1 hypothetical protein JHK82_020520 [Glycine max]
MASLESRRIFSAIDTSWKMIAPRDHRLAVSDRLPDPNRVAASQSTLTSPILENVSHGQLQTRSSVPFDFAMTFVVYLKAIDGHGEAMGLSVAKSGDDGGAVDRGGGRQWWCTEVSDMDRRKKERRKNSDGGQLVVCGGDDER